MTRITHYKREWLDGCKIIDRPMSKVELVVAHPVTEKNRIRATEPGKSDKYIVNLKAVPVDKLPKLKEVFAGGKTEVPVEEVRDVFLTAAIWVNDGEEPGILPLKGEKVLCSIDFVPNRDRTTHLLRVTQMVQQPVVVLEEVSWSDIFEDAPSNIDADTTPQAEKDELVHK